ncbi:3-hydroxyacyl-CoA dehydrogenase family protein [Hymenobacter humi]|uniref:3-hydroxyacyl-CoA dehydrogenase family protein n=1 Tax=Hymenobacter humi TaxID=1411620 RepID=A0ABW2TZM3_9BACT
MHILVLDGNHVETEFREKFGSAHEYTFLHTAHGPERDEDAVQQVIDVAAATAAVAFFFPAQFAADAPYRLLAAATFPVFVETTCHSLADSLSDPKNGPTTGLFFGFCGLPTLLNRQLLEVSVFHEADHEQLAATCATLGTDFRVVADRVGLVTPRVICQIINEACFTVQEGTATMQDVDLGMKLGTNYPHGPFAWANAIGVPRVYRVLESLWNDTHDERYKICPLLKRQAQRGEPFAV